MNFGHANERWHVFSYRYPLPLVNSHRLKIRIAFLFGTIALRFPCMIRSLAGDLSLSLIT